MFESYYKILTTLQSMQTSETMQRGGFRKWKNIWYIYY
jgi:hypothetical protein